jgi:hypothetical protein
MDLHALLASGRPAVHAGKQDGLGHAGRLGKSVLLVDRGNGTVELGLGHFTRSSFRFSSSNLCLTSRTSHFQILFACLARLVSK